MSGDEKEDFFLFLESLANSSYINFHNIKNSSRTDDILKRLRITPSSYLHLIYSLTDDWTQEQINIEQKVRNVNDLAFIKSFQILTEYGICYTTNSLLALNLSTALLMENKILPEDPFYKKLKLYEMRFGNIFEGDITYSFFGFPSAVSIYLHSSYETMNIARSLGYSNEAYELEAYSIEIVTTKQFREDSFISQRGCRFHSESNLTHFKVYSKLLCLSECRLDAAMKLCGCIPHFYPNNSKNNLNFNIQLKILFQSQTRSRSVATRNLCHASRTRKLFSLSFKMK